MFVPGQSKNITDTVKSSSAPDVLKVNDLAINTILNRQYEEGYWVYELEADITIPAEYVLLKFIIDDRDTNQE